MPGASLALTGGIVAYDTALKRSLLGVDGALLAERGPVDAEVARQMARGVRIACAVPRGEGASAVPRDDAASAGADPAPADIGIATTGVAGPDPDPQTGQPAGTVWLGVSSVLGERAVELHFVGDRARIRSATVDAALAELGRELASIAQLNPKT